MVRTKTILSIGFIFFLAACGLSPTPATTDSVQTQAPAPTEFTEPIAPTQELFDTETQAPTERADQITPTPGPVETEPPRSVVIHFLIGHGEFKVDEEAIYYDERSYIQFKSALESLGYTIATVNLSEGDEIPADARLIVIAGPMTPVPRTEVSQLQTFVDGGGSLVILEETLLLSGHRNEADPLAEYLEAFWSIKLRNDLVLDQSSGELSLTIETEPSGQHASVEKVSKLPVVFDSARSVTPMEGTEGSLVELVKSSQQSWAEMESDVLLVGIAAGSLAGQPDEGVDLLGPVTLAVAGEHPNGSRIAVFGDADFVSDRYYSQAGNADLFVNTIEWALAAAQPLSLGTETSNEQPASGDLIAFASGDNDGWVIYLMKPDGSGLTRLQGELDLNVTSVSSSDFDLTWSLDGQSLAFRSGYQGYQGNQDIFVADLQKGSYQRIGGTDRDDEFPTWSPDNQWIVFASQDRIWRINPDGTGMDSLINVVDQVTGTGALSFATHPSFSPDGRYLVAAAGTYQVGQFDIIVMDFESGSDEATLLIKNENANDFYPAFAPSGFKLAFISAASMDSGYDLYFTDLQGEPVKLTDHEAHFPFPFAWSPDGNMIAYSVQIGERSEIFVVEPGGAGPVQLTGEPLSGETLGFSEDGSRFPSWSPDSSRIAFQTNRDGNWEIYVMNADGSGQTNITNSAAMDISPAWQP